jgi:hypothetical protein
MSEDAVNFLIVFGAVLGAAIWWLVRDSDKPRGPGSSDHFSPGDPGSRYTKGEQ